MPRGLYTSPAILGEGFQQGLAIGGDLQRTALDAQTLRAASEEIRQKQKPIPVEKFMEQVPDFLRPHVLSLAESSGVVEQNGDMKYVRAGAGQGFIDQFKTNKVWQATAYDKANQDLQKTLSPMQQQYGVHKQRVEAWMAQKKMEYENAVVKDPKNEGKSIIDAVKRFKIEAEVKEFQEKHPDVIGMKQLEKQITDVSGKRMKTLQVLGLIDDGFKKDVEKYGEEPAIRIAQGLTTRQKLDTEKAQMEARVRGDEIRLTARENAALKTEEQWSDPYEANIGGKKVMVRKNLSTNKVEKIGEDKSTTIVVQPNGGHKADANNAMKLRKEFNALPEIKERNQTIPKIKSMKAAFAESKKTNNFVAVDQALITLYNKLTDPTSVVRESEYARTAQNIPLLNQIKGKVDKVMTGGAGLTSAEREALMKMATLMEKGYDDIYQLRRKEYHSYGQQIGIDSSFLLDSNNMADAPQVAIPKAAIADLKRNPNTAKQFDEIFGAGASKRYLGGKK